MMMEAIIRRRNRGSDLQKPNHNCAICVKLWDAATNKGSRAFHRIQLGQIRQPAEDSCPRHYPLLQFIARALFYYRP